MGWRFLVPAALVAICIAAPEVRAQGRVSVVVRPGPPRASRPAPQTVPPLRPLPIPTMGATPAPFPRPALHRPFLFRSAIAGLIVLDPYWWLPPGVAGEQITPAPVDTHLSGGLQLDVEPRRALVYVDGVLAGTVDQFSGYFQHLETTAGYHVLDFLTPDYEPLTIGVTVVPNKTTTYKASLNRVR